MNFSLYINDILILLEFLIYCLIFSFTYSQRILQKCSLRFYVCLLFVHFLFVFFMVMHNFLWRNYNVWFCKHYWLIIVYYVCTEFFDMQFLFHLISVCHFMIIYWSLQTIFWKCLLVALNRLISYYPVKILRYLYFDDNIQQFLYCDEADICFILEFFCFCCLIYRSKKSRKYFLIFYVNSFIIIACILNFQYLLSFFLNNSSCIFVNACMHIYFIFIKANYVDHLLEYFHIQHILSYSILHFFSIILLFERRYNIE